MKKIVLIAGALMLAQASFATTFKCTLSSSFHHSDGSTAYRKMIGYVNSADDNDSGRLAQIEINARNGSVQPFAAVTAYDNQVIVQLFTTEILETKLANKQTLRQVVNKPVSGLNKNSASTTDKQGNGHSISCVESK